MPGKIFINYRRGDEPGFALALYGRLEASFSTEQLFMDVEGGIPAGRDFVHELETQVAQCDVLLALIGQGWLTAKDDNGASRLDNPDDFVRVEIESAMRLDKRVVPVLVNKAEMPRAADLPGPLQPLARRNAVRLTQERFRADVQGLVTALEAALREAEAARDAASTAAAEEKLRQQREEAVRAEKAARAEKERMRLEAIAGLSAEQIAKAEEFANWDFIKTSVSTQEFRDHLARFPGGVTERFARARLEDLMWAELGPAPGLDQLGDFLAEFPRGTHAKAAADRRAALEREQAAAQEARELQRGETEAWAAASNAGAADALAVFLKEWPQSRHADAARSRIRELKGAPTRRRLLQGVGGAIGLAAVAGGLIWTFRPLLFDRSIRTFRGHSGVVDSVAFSPDGGTVLSGSHDGTLKLWEVATGKEIQTFAGHSRLVTSVTFSPDGRTALSGSDDSVVKLWEVATGKVLRTFAGHGSTVRSVAFSPDGRSALSGSWDKTLRLWEVVTGKELRTFTGHSAFVDSVAFSPDGRNALSGDWEGTIKLWEVATGKELRTFEDVLRRGHVYSIAFSPDGRTALCGSVGSAELSEVATGKWLQAFNGPSTLVFAIAFSPDGHTVLSAGNDRTFSLWEVTTGKELRTFTGHWSDVTSVAFSPDGSTALSGSEDKTLKLWDLTER